MFFPLGVRCYLCVEVVVASEKALALRNSGKLAREYSEKDKAVLVEDVFDGMAKGMRLSEVAVKYKVDPGTIRRWIAKDPDWFQEYRFARALMGQALAEEALAIAARSTNQTVTADRLKIDTLQWAASRMNPVEFGDKQYIQQDSKQVVEIKVVEEAVEVPYREVKPLARKSANA